MTNVMNTSGDIISRYDFFNSEIEKLKLITEVQIQKLEYKINSIMENLKYIIELLENQYAQGSIQEESESEEIDINSI